MARKVHAIAALACAGLLGLAGGALADPITTLYNTGTDSAHATLVDGTLGDPHYILASYPANSATVLLIRTAAGGFPIGPWLADDTLSTWVGPNSVDFPFGHFGGVNDLIDYPGTYVYRTTFDLTGLDPATATITGAWGSDNDGLDIRINGISLGYTTPHDQYQNPLAAFTVTTGFVKGINTLEFVVDNEGINNGPTGLRVEMSGTADVARVAPPLTPVNVPALDRVALAALAVLVMACAGAALACTRRT